jgi:hypothetical protein
MTLRMLCKSIVKTFSENAITFRILSQLYLAYKIKGMACDRLESEQAGSSASAADFYSENTGFELQPGQRISSLRFHGFPECP